MMDMIIKHVLEMMMMTLFPQVKKEGSQSAMRLCMGSRRGFIARIKVSNMLTLMTMMRESQSDDDNVVVREGQSYACNDDEDEQ